jgi:hypothetical protein
MVDSASPNARTKKRARESELNGESHQILPLINMALSSKTIKRNGIYIFLKTVFLYVLNCIFAVIRYFLSPSSGIFLRRNENIANMNLICSPAKGDMIRRMATPGNLFFFPSRHTEPDCLEAQMAAPTKVVRFPNRKKLHLVWSSPSLEGSDQKVQESENTPRQPGEAPTSTLRKFDDGSTVPEKAD